MRYSKKNLQIQNPKMTSRLKIVSITFVSLYFANTAMVSATPPPPTPLDLIQKTHKTQINSQFKTSQLKIPRHIHRFKMPNRQKKQPKKTVIKSTTTIKKIRTKTPPQITKKSKVKVITTPKTPLPKRVRDFVVPESLIQDILKTVADKKDHTITSSFDGNFKHVVTDKKLRSHGIKELIGVGTSRFYHSTFNRKKNIYATIEKFDGIVIPQGKTFSFNQTLDSVNPADGFVYEKVIIGDKDEYQLGGGVCQVSTTLYRSIFNTGLPINTRRNHSRKVSYYWPHGFDATIYLGGQDFKFTNDTPGPVMIQFVIEGNNMIVLTYGTKDRQVDTTEHGGWNLAYWWKRVVTKGDQIDEKVFRSYYKPKKIEVAEADKVTEKDLKK